MSLDSSRKELFSTCKEIYAGTFHNRKFNKEKQNAQDVNCTVQNNQSNLTSFRDSTEDVSTDIEIKQEVMNDQYGFRKKCGTIDAIAAMQVFQLQQDKKMSNKI